MFQNIFSQMIYLDPRLGKDQLFLFSSEKALPTKPVVTESSGPNFVARPFNWMVLSKDVTSWWFEPI